LSDPWCTWRNRFLLHDRDALFTETFRQTLAAAGIETVRLSPKSSNLNAFAERFGRTMKESCLDRLILVGEASLRQAVREFVAHYHEERNHQGLGNVLIFPGSPMSVPSNTTLLTDPRRLSVDPVIRHYAISGET